MRTSSTIARLAVSTAAVASLTGAPGQHRAVQLLRRELRLPLAAALRRLRPGRPVGLSQLAVEIDCAATSPYVVDRTGVGCFIRGLGDRLTYLRTGPLFVAGNAAAASNAGFVPFQGYELCVGAGYSTATGEFRDVQSYRCQ